MHNVEVRSAIKRAGFFNYEIAEAMGIPETSFSRKLRRELSDDEKADIMNTVARLAAERNSMNGGDNIAEKNG